VTREARRAALALAALAAAVLAIAWAAGWLDALGGSLAQRQAAAARDALIEEVFAPVLETEELRARAEGLGAGQQQALLFDLAREGVARLPDAVLLERLALLRDVATGADERACAMVLLGGAPGAAGDLLDALDEGTLRRWLELSREAVLASLRDEPARPLAPEDAERARKALLGAMAPADAERFVTALQSLAGLSQAEACALARAALGAATSLPPGERELVARLFASG
jgi:hypothetical protein